MVSGMMIASDPPAIMTSASPRWMIFIASPIAWLPVAHAVTIDEFGPLAPKRIEISPEAMFTMSIGMKNGRDAVRALLEQDLVGLEQRRDAADAGAHQHPEARARPPARRSRPASSTAIAAQAIAYLRKGSNLRSSFLSM